MIRDESGVIDLSRILSRRSRTTGEEADLSIRTRAIHLFLSADQRWIYRILLIYHRFSLSIKKTGKDLQQRSNRNLHPLLPRKYLLWVNFRKELINISSNRDIENFAAKEERGSDLNRSSCGVDGRNYRNMVDLYALTFETWNVLRSLPFIESFKNPCCCFRVDRAKGEESGKGGSCSVAEGKWKKEEPELPGTEGRKGG